MEAHFAREKAEILQSRRAPERKHAAVQTERCDPEPVQCPSCSAEKRWAQLSTEVGNKVQRPTSSSGPGKAAKCDSAAQTDPVICNMNTKDSNPTTTAVSRRPPVISASSMPQRSQSSSPAAEAAEDLMHLMAKAREDNRDLWAKTHVGMAIEAQSSFTDWVDVTSRTKSSQGTFAAPKLPTAQHQQPASQPQPHLQL